MRLALDLHVTARCLDCGAAIDDWERLAKPPRTRAFHSDDARTVRVEKPLACPHCLGSRAEVTLGKTTITPSR